MQQLAWLHAAPDAADGKPGTTSRLQRLHNDGLQPDVPDPGPAAYLLDWLWDAGPTLPTGMGNAPLTWTELRAWATSTATRLRPWEGSTLRALSRAYLAQQQQSTAPACPAPYVTAEGAAAAQAARRAAISQRMRSLFARTAAAVQTPAPAPTTDRDPE